MRSRRVVLAHGPVRRFDARRGAPPRRFPRRGLPWLLAGLCLAGCGDGSENGGAENGGAKDADSTIATRTATERPAPGTATVTAPGLPEPDAARAPATHAPGAGVQPFEVPAIAARPGQPLPNFLGTDLSQDAILRGLGRLRPTEFSPVGSTSTVFRVPLAGPYAAAFKSATKERPRGPVAEVAAYRLARCLGLRNVPPAISRSFPKQTLRSLYRPTRGKPGWDRVAPRLLQTPQGVVHGVMIYWIPDLTDLGLDRERSVTRWTRWLTQGTPIGPEPALAAHLSTMLVFDYLIGNFDRFSGSNARGRPDRSALYLRDHDVAFAGRLGEPLHRRILERMLRAERFSKSFYGRLLRLDRACFETELQKDPAAAAGPLLSQGRVDGVFERLRAAKSHIGSLLAVHGEAAVLPFP